MASTTRPTSRVKKKQMKRLLNFGRFAAALLAVFITAVGVPVALCAAMPDRPSMAPATACHETSGGERHCAPPRVEARDDCCGAMAAQPPPATLSKAVPTGPGLSALLPAAITVSIAPAASPAAFAPVSRLFQRSGRALLSLHHTLLI